MGPTSAENPNSTPLLADWYQGLARAGFVRYDHGKLDWPLGPDFHCWLRLNVRKREDGYEVEPLVGVHATTIERFWTAIKTGPYRAQYNRDHATFATQLLALTTEVEPFPLRGGKQDKACVRRLAGLYRSIGLEFARAYASYDALEPVLRARVNALAGNPERLAACLLLMGPENDAALFVRSFAVRRPSYFDGFARPFMAALEAAGMRMSSDP